MALRFRHTLRIALGIRLNFGKRGITLSTSLRGASVTLDNNSIWDNVGLSGIGMSYRTRLTDSFSHQRRVDRWSLKGSLSNTVKSISNIGAFSLQLDDRGLVTEWNHALVRHHQDQSVQVDKFLEINSKDYSWMLEVLSAELSELDWPREILVDFDISVEDQTVFIDVDLPTVDAFPTQSASLFAKRNFSEVERIDPVTALELFELLRDMTKTGIFRSITPMGHALI